MSGDGAGAGSSGRGCADAGSAAGGDGFQLEFAPLTDGAALEAGLSVRTRARMWEADRRRRPACERCGRQRRRGMRYCTACEAIVAAALVVVGWGRGRIFAWMNRAEWPLEGEAPPPARRGRRPAA